MKRYSAFAIAREAVRFHTGWERAWRSPAPKKDYEAIIIGAGGHGLATAYYLGKNHGITNVAIIEKGWLGGGNTGRNTTIIRSNYLQDESAAIYEKARSLYETLSQDLNYNIMFSPRGVMMLAQTEHEIRGYKRTEHANRLQGVETRFISPAEVKKLVPIIELSGPRYPVQGALWQPRGGTARHDAVAWGYARAADALGVDIIQNCEVTGFRIENGVVKGCETTRGYIGANKVGVVVAGMQNIPRQTAISAELLREVGRVSGVVAAIGAILVGAAVMGLGLPGYFAGTLAASTWALVAYEELRRDALPALVAFKPL